MDHGLHDEEEAKEAVRRVIRCIDFSVHCPKIQVTNTSIRCKGLPEEVVNMVVDVDQEDVQDLTTIPMRLAGSFYIFRSIL